jgi:beta-alanine degradation protein BauB
MCLAQSAALYGASVRAWHVHVDAVDHRGSDSGQWARSLSMKDVPPAHKLLMRSRKVRVWEMILEPGESYPLHHHRYPYLSIQLEDATVVTTDPRGQKHRLKVRKGDVLWFARPDAHSVRNVGRTTFRNRLVELTA